MIYFCNIFNVNIILSNVSFIYMFYTELIIIISNDNDKKNQYIKKSKEKRKQKKNNDIK